MAFSLATEFRSLSLGDPRRDRRARMILEGWSRAPQASFPQMFESEAEEEGLYGFVENPYVNPELIFAAHRVETSARIEQTGESLVLVLHDTTTFSFPGESERKDLGWVSSETQGFHGHFALAVSADGTRCPFGVVGLSTIMPPRPPPPKTPKEESTTRTRATDPTRESLRWGQLACKVSEDLRGIAIAVHVMDREGDAYITLGTLCKNALRFVIRVSELSRLVTNEADNFAKKASIRTVVERSISLVERDVELSRRRRQLSPSLRKKHPPREARTARLEISTARVRLPKPHYVVEEVPESIEVNVVCVREIDAPDGVEPVLWVLYTTESIDTVEDVLRLVDIYRARWLIEEFFKALKTGCAYEKRQLESAHALLIALALCTPVAWQMLALRHLSRTNPDAPASDVVAPERVAAIRTIARKPLPPMPTIKDVCYAIAALGGHKARNGPPGWITLRRGFDKLLFAERVLAAAKSTERCG